MSEPKPLYLSVGSGTTAFADLLIRAHGALVEISGPGYALLPPAEARKAIKQIEAILTHVDPDHGAEGDSEAFPAIPDAADVLEGFSDGLYRVMRLKKGWRITRVKETDGKAI